MSLKVGILRFLGTNCDRDIWSALESVGHKPDWLWYQDRFDHNDYSAFVVPGGFSYGDYLRSGALAARMPVVDSLREADNFGKPILGICNGFQILCEGGFLPGALIRNKDRHFIDEWVSLVLENSCKAWGAHAGATTPFKMPIAHGEGRYFVRDDGLKSLQDNGQIWWKYQNNPNGSLDDIAGIMNKKKNIAALMPHPERAMYAWMGSEDGRAFFDH